MRCVRHLECRCVRRTITRVGHKIRKAMDGRSNYLPVALVTCCLALACCTNAGANRSTFEKGERDFYRSRANDSHYIFQSTLDFFANQKAYEAAIAESAKILSHEGRWILVEKFSPALGYFQISFVYESQADKLWKAYTIDSDASQLTEVDVKPVATRVDKLWSEVPPSDEASDALSMNDPVVYYISLGRKAEVRRRLAVVNPGFKKKASDADAKIQLDMPVDDTYLRLSSYTMELLSILNKE